MVCYMRILQKKVNFINSGHVGHGPLGRDCRKKNCPPLMMWEKTIFDSTIGVPFRKKQKNYMDSISRSVCVAAGLHKVFRI